MTSIETAGAVLDLLAEFRGKTLTTADKIEVAKEFTGLWNEGGEHTNEELAYHFLDQLVRRIRKQGEYNSSAHYDYVNAATKRAALDAAKSNL